MKSCYLIEVICDPILVNIRVLVNSYITTCMETVR
jgi:hypothetical protein